MPKKITQAFILGAGLGTRLRPLTNTVPKVMIPIAEGKPLLEHHVEWFRDRGITDFIFNIHYLPDVITSYFGDGKKWGVRIRYSDERDVLLETGGALKKAEAMLDDDFLFMYGDELHFLELKPLVDFHLQHDALATIALKTSDIPANGEIAEFDPSSHKIARWHTRPHTITELTDTHKLNAGLYALSKRILDYIPVGVPIKLDGEVLPKAFAANKPIYAYPTDELVIDIGTIEKYEWAKEHYKKHTTGS